ncbi:hypothetical protein DH09_06320 [Bacillaceae bacterium JMAK1]|nr:hypothetical protein DH09_06320 [Bacillaceae bacterium JMAK1]
MLTKFTLRQREKRRQLTYHPDNKYVVEFLEQKIDEFVKRTKPVFLLDEHELQSLKRALHSPAKQRGWRDRSKTARQKALFYNKDLQKFVQDLEKDHDFQLKGKESLFVQLLITTVQLWNMSETYRKYGNFVTNGDTIATVFNRYIELVEGDEQFSEATIESLRKQMICHKLVSVTIKPAKLKHQLMLYKKRQQMISVSPV